MGNAFGSQVNPSPVNPLVGQGTQSDILNALLNVGQWNGNGGQAGDKSASINGVPGYNGALSPNVNNTILPSVTSNWQPWDGGTSYIANQLGTGQYDPTKNMPPSLTQMMASGGTGGPGNQAQLQQLKYGTPSQAGQYVSNMANYGMSSAQSGKPMADLAYGQNAQLNAFLLPFMQNNSPYKGPQVNYAPRRGATL